MKLIVMDSINSRETLLINTVHLLQIKTRYLPAIIKNVNLPFSFINKL